MNKPKILVTESLGPKGLEYLNAHADVDAYDLLDPDELPAKMDHYDAVIIRSAHRLTYELMANHPRLKVVARAGAGVDNVDLKAATELGLAVINAPGANAIAAAEHTFGLMLAVMRNIRTGDLHVREGGWNRYAYLGEELHGRCLGIIGLGRVGRQVARIAHGFQMTVVAYDPYITDDIFQANKVTKVTSLAELFPQVDVLTLHTPKTGPHLGTKELTQLREGAVIINAARGGMIDEDALYELLTTGHLRGVGMDVFQTEPPARDFSLFTNPHVVMTPHLGGSTHEALAEVGLMTARGVIQALQGQTPPNIVNVPIPVIEQGEFAALDQSARTLGKIFSTIFTELTPRIILTLRGNISQAATPWLKQTVLASILNERLDDRVNTVNALIKAEQQGIKFLIEEEYSADTEGSLSLRWEGRPDTLTEISLQNQRPYIRSIAGIRISLPWPARALLTRHHDSPGVVGQVGTLVGRYGVNIGNLYLGRAKDKNEALMVLTLDNPVSEPLLHDIAQIEAIQNVYIFD